jgi:hypothetical protein
LSPLDHELYIAVYDELLLYESNALGCLLARAVRPVIEDRIRLTRPPP